MGPIMYLMRNCLDEERNLSGTESIRDADNSR